MQASARTELARRPWQALPPEVAAVLRPELVPLADEIIAAISEAVPIYARPLEGEFGRALRVGVEEALQQFVGLIERPAPARERMRAVYVGLGRAEMRAGRTLDALLAAYRVGARVAWRHLARAGERAGLAPEVMYLLAEAIFAYIDELSAESVEGYAQEQAARAGRMQERRGRLVALLVQHPAPDPTAVEALAAEAGWQLPPALAAACVELATGEEPDRLAARLGADWLVGAAAPAGGGAPRPLACVVVPDPCAPGREAQLVHALGGRRAALGPPVAWTEAALSFERAAQTLRLAREGLVCGERSLLRADDHAVALLLRSDRRLARDVARRRLAPLDGETPASRTRLADTLHAWLRHGGRTGDAARELHVHPQTVRYRVARLRELFGDELEDPDARFELLLALRLRVPEEA